MPRLGGVAIFGAFGLVLGLAWFMNLRLDRAANVNPAGVVGFGAGAICVFAAGVWDDLRSLRPHLKLAFESLAATLVVAYGGCCIRVLSTPAGPVELGLAGGPLTVLWIVAITNAVNLLDGLDGLAAGVVSIALGTIVALVGPEHMSVTVISVILLGACIGFLAHNFHPATIFMGDSGSLFLGFALGVLSTYASSKASIGAITVVPVLIVALPLADITWAAARRYVKDLVPSSARSHLAGVARMFVPDRRHIHHRLLAAGLDQREAIYVLYGIQAIACVAAIYIVLVWSAGSRETDPRATTAPIASLDRLGK